MIPTKMWAQGEISYEYLSESSLRDEPSNRFGSGSMQTVRGGYNFVLSNKEGKAGKPVAWNAQMSATYAMLNNRGEAEAEEMNPGSMVNVSLGLTHTRPLSAKWSLMTVIGGGIYASKNMIKAKSMLANGGVMMICRVSENLELGFGGGISNSYGVPMAMPMLYLNWQKRGRFDFKIDMSNGLKVAASTMLWHRMIVELTAIEMDGTAAVTEIEGRSKIYSTVMLKSYISPQLVISPKLRLCISVGGNWLRGTSISDRTLRGFLDTFKDNRNDPYFTPALRLQAGIRYAF